MLYSSVTLISTFYSSGSQPPNTFTGVAYQIPCISAIYITIHNKITVMEQQ